MRFGNGLPRQSVPQGHLLRGADWLAMTDFFDKLRPASPVFFLINTKIHRETGGKRIDNVEKIWYNDLLYIGGMAL